MMHDIDRTLAELEAMDDADDFDGAESSFELEDDDPWQELEDDDDDEDDVVLSDDEELELASDLLGVSDEDELEQFLRGFAKRFRRKVKGYIGRGRRIFKKGVLGAVMKRIAPLAGTAAGGMIGGPTGAAMASKVLGAELDGLGPEEYELEVARKFVRLAASALSNAARDSQTSASAEEVARSALEEAARRHAPGLLRSKESAAKQGGATSGTWVRRGRVIVLRGV